MSVLWGQIFSTRSSSQLPIFPVCLLWEGDCKFCSQELELRAQHSCKSENTGVISLPMLYNEEIYLLMP